MIKLAPHRPAYAPDKILLQKNVLFCRISILFVVLSVHFTADTSLKEDFECWTFTCNVGFFHEWINIGSE